MFTSNRSSVTICDRLKQRYGYDRQDWQSLFKSESHEKNSRDFEFIQYIVNFIIEQAKHNIVISELPEVIRTLHYQAEEILRKNRMITLQEVIAQVQTTGAMKYPYLKRVKPISTEDFVREVICEVFDRLGTKITLDMIENISQFTTCSAEQLLHAMPAIDVNEAATLIIEDISRNQRENQKQTDVLKKMTSLSPSSTKVMNRQVDRKLDGTSTSISKERMRFERDSSRSIQNSQQSPSKTKLSEYKDLSIIMTTPSQSPKSSSTSRQSSKNINKNQQSRSDNQIDSTEKQLVKLNESNSHLTQTIRENPFVTTRPPESVEKPKCGNIFSSTFIPFDICSMTECLQVETEQKILNTKPDSNIRKSCVKSSVPEQTKNPKEKMRNPLRELFSLVNNHRINREKNQTVKLCKSKSNTQTYSIQSEEGLSIPKRKPPTTVVANMNANATVSSLIKSTRSLTKISENPGKQILSHTVSSTKICPFSPELCDSKDRRYIINSMHSIDLEETKSYSLRHYNKYCYLYSDISDNEEQMTETDTDNCPLEAVLNQRLVQHT